MELPKRRMFMNSLFDGCSIQSRSLNNKINRLHECCLRINYNDKRSNFGELDYYLKIYTVSIHHAVEMYKVVHGIYPE